MYVEHNVVVHTHRLDCQASSSPLCQQEGVFRVNCMDCLDRTNVIESVFAREVLQTVVSSTISTHMHCSSEELFHSQFTCMCILKCT